MQVSLGSSSLEGVREVGGFGQPLHSLYPQIQAVLSSELGSEATHLFAEPVVDHAGNRIDWYTQGDPDQKPVRLNDLSEAQQQPILDQIDRLLARGQELIARYATSNDPRRVQLGAMLKAVLHSPAATDIFIVQDQPVIIGWGFALDRPWDITAAASRPITTPPSAPPSDVAMPEIAMPELVGAVEPTTIPPSAALSSPAIDASSKPLVPESLPELPSQSEPLQPADLPQQPTSRLQPERPPAAAVNPPPLFKADAVETVAQQHPSPSSADASAAAIRQTFPLRYVVVGSRYFWSVFALSVVFAVATIAFWINKNQNAASPIAEADGLLIQAQQAEQALRARLNQLSTQLAARSSQCKPSTDANPTAANPALTDSNTVHSVHANKASAASPIQSTVSGNQLPTTSALTATTPADAIDSEQPLRAPPTTPNASDAIPDDSPHKNGNGREPQPNTLSSSTDLTPTSATPATSGSVTRESLEQTLENALTGPPSAPLKRPPSTTLPTKTEPTPDERQEFTNRLSAAGATTGEITVTLLWNSSADMDLVVRCPSGQQLDYRNPSACGGALDVDANSDRTHLRERPVENAFWPAGKAAPGAYEIAVRYAPRKDEQKPQETPFQVRFIRGGQESVFKGIAQPNAVMPVTAFTIER